LALLEYVWTADGGSAVLRQRSTFAGPDPGWNPGFVPPGCMPLAL
jgi:hypothetical protein